MQLFPNSSSLTFHMTLVSHFLILTLPWLHGSLFYIEKNKIFSPNLILKTDSVILF